MLVVVCSLGILGALASASRTVGAHWGYSPSSGILGPLTWSQAYKDCGGHKQSPINIETFSSEKSDYGETLTTKHYSNYYQTKITNNGHSVVLQFADSGQPKPLLFGGNLPKGEIFEFDGLHWHWGADSQRGSEHRLDGVSFPVEMHLVHFNKKYGSLESAANKADGLAVAAFFIKVSGRDNKGYSRVIKNLYTIKDEKDVAGIGLHSLKDLIPSDATNQHFFYQGSLTTPPCTENVFWNVFLDTNYLSEKQLSAFRTLKTQNGRSISDNYRPLQKRNGRQISLYSDDLFK